MFNCLIAARDFKVKGKILDKSTGKAISYAIIRNSDSNCATTANSEGSFEIALNASNNILICSSIGDISDTVYINTISKKDSTNIFLTPASALHKIKPDSTKRYSAEDLISKVLASVKAMYSSINNYEFISRNRYIIRENNGVGIGSGTVKVDDGIFKRSINLISNIWKNKPMRINGIIEYSSKGYFYGPSSYNEIIEGQKSHSSLPSSLNELLGSLEEFKICAVMSF